jgi:hypothetical protein
MRIATYANQAFHPSMFFNLRSVPCERPDPRGPVATTRKSWVEASITPLMQRGRFTIGL